MELIDATRSIIIESIKTLIDGSSGNAYIDFYDNENSFIVRLLLNNPCIVTPASGSGIFDNTVPYLKGTVAPGNSGIINRFTLFNSSGSSVLSGSCGDSTHQDKDIIFNTLTCYDYDVVELNLSITIPTGSNSYI